MKKLSNPEYQEITTKQKKLPKEFSDKHVFQSLLPEKRLNGCLPTVTYEELMHTNPLSVSLISLLMK